MDFLKEDVRCWNSYLEKQARRFTWSNLSMDYGAHTTIAKALCEFWLYITDVAPITMFGPRRLWRQDIQPMPKRVMRVQNLNAYYDYK